MSNNTRGSGQLKLPFPKTERGVSFLRGGARRYAQSRGLHYSPEGLDEVQAAPAFQTAVGREYDAAEVVPDERIASAYKALSDETNAQFDYLTRGRTEGGLGVAVDFTPENPYASHEELVDDISRNRRLAVNQTGSLEEDKAAEHPYLDPATNDKFRAVHDAFGHASIGRSFSRHGEEAAYQSHAQMFSPAAHPALVAETRAQNSAMNFGDNPGVFPDQKPVMLPEWTRSPTRERPEPTARRSPLQARQFTLPV